MVVFRAVDLTSAWSIISSGFLNVTFDSPLVLGNAFSNDYLWQLVSRLGFPIAPYFEVCVVMIAAGGICWLLPSSQKFLANYEPVITADGSTIKPGRIAWRPDSRYAVLMALMLGLSLLSISAYSKFIYFQF